MPGKVMDRNGRYAGGHSGTLKIVKKGGKQMTARKARTGK